MGQQRIQQPTETLQWSVTSLREQELAWSSQIVDAPPDHWRHCHRAYIHRTTASERRPRLGSAILARRQIPSHHHFKELLKRSDAFTHVRVVLHTYTQTRIYTADQFTVGHLLLCIHLSVTQDSSKPIFWLYSNYGTSPCLGTLHVCWTKQIAKILTVYPLENWRIYWELTAFSAQISYFVPLISLL